MDLISSIFTANENKEINPQRIFLLLQVPAVHIYSFPLKEKNDCHIYLWLFPQAQKLTQCPMGIIAKAAPILSEENLIDIIPVAWELIMETDQELAASAGNIQLCRFDSFMYKYVVWSAENVLNWLSWSCV